MTITIITIITIVTDRAKCDGRDGCDGCDGESSLFDRPNTHTSVLQPMITRMVDNILVCPYLSACVQGRP